MGITVIANLINEDPLDYGALATATIGELRERGRHYRHPDSALISYPQIAENPLSTSAFEKPLNIAVVGGGVAGIAAIYELSRLPEADKTISIALFERDPDHFATKSTTADTQQPKETAENGEHGEPGRAESTQSDHETGAMRFPETAGLTWYYVSQVFDDKKVVEAFPNPGKVPTEFLHGERVDRYVGNQWLDPQSPTRQLAQKALDGLFGVSTGPNVSLFQIGQKDPAKISEELKSPDTKPERLAQIFDEWKIFAHENNNVTLGSAVEQIVTAKCDQLPNAGGLPPDDKQAKINYYVELFGRYGFGNAGYKPLLTMSLVEMMRLNLWQYSNEFSLPVNANTEFVSRLYQQAVPKLKELKVERARVCDVCHLDEAGGTKAGIVFYRIEDNGEENPNPCLERYDYVILAVSPKQASAISSRAGFKNVARHVMLGDYKRQYKQPLNVRPPFVLKAGADGDAANSQIRRAMNRVNMANAAKIFISLKKSVFDALAPDFKEFGKIKAIVSDCGLAATSIVSSIVRPDCYNILMSYSGEEEKRNLQSELKKEPKNGGEQSTESRSTPTMKSEQKKDPKQAGDQVAENRWWLNEIINRTVRDVLRPVDPANTKEQPEYKRWWFGELLSKADDASALTDAMFCEWTTHNNSGEFKIDAAGDHYNSNLLFRYHTHACQAETLQNRFFLANDSYSHLGGWMEGALMSSLNAVCGLIVAANNGRIEKLSEEARKIITTFDKVA